MLKTTKPCNKCGIIKNLSEYHFRKDTNKHRNDCISCKKEYDKKYRAKNSEKLKAYSSKYFIENKDKRIKYKYDNRDSIREKAKVYRENRHITEEMRQSRREYARLYQSVNMEAIQKRRSEYYIENRDSIILKTLKYKSENKAKVQSAYKLRYANNKEVIKARAKKYRQTEQGKMSQINGSNKYRFLQKSTSDNTIPMRVKYPLTKELQNLLDLQDNKCNNCQKDLSDGKHLDHHVPISKGGYHSLNNVVWLCPSCNLHKSATMPTTLLLI